MCELVKCKVKTFPLGYAHLILVWGLADLVESEYIYFKHLRENLCYMDNLLFPF